MQFFTDLTDRASEQISGGAGQGVDTATASGAQPGGSNGFKTPTPDPASYDLAGFGVTTAGNAKGGLGK